jgi:hypothetical protein
MDHSCPSRPKAMNWNEMRAPRTWVRVYVYQIGQAPPLRIECGRNDRLDFTNLNGFDSQWPCPRRVLIRR